MIGLTLVTTALVVGDSVKASMATTFERSAKADYYVTDELEDVDVTRRRWPASSRQSKAVGAATGFAEVDARVDGTVTGVAGFDFDQIDHLLDLDVTQGSFDTDVEYPAVVSVDEAKATGAEWATPSRSQSATGASVDATIVGLFDDQAILGEDYLFDTRVLQPSASRRTPNGWRSRSPTMPRRRARTRLAGLANEYPYAAVETADQFRDRVAGMVDKILAMVNAMVALAVVIALIGIGNTLALSVFERTRELGLVRAVGMTRRQVRRMVRFEAALVALFGATLGVGLGLLFGYGVVGALPSTFVSTFSVPVPSILVVVLVAAVAGVVAASSPPAGRPASTCSTPSPTDATVSGVRLPQGA